METTERIFEKLSKFHTNFIFGEYYCRTESAHKRPKCLWYFLINDSKLILHIISIGDVKKEPRS